MHGSRAFPIVFLECTGEGIGVPRPIKGWWDNRSRRYLARLGELSPTTGKPTPVVLRHPDGRPIAWGESGAVADAVRRLLADREQRTRLASGPTVRDVCAAFVAWHAEAGSAARTVRDHDYQLRRFASHVRDGVRLADRPAATIGPEDLWAVEAAAAGGVRHLYLSALACWRWAARPVKGRQPVRLIPANPLAGMPRPQAGSRGDAGLLPWPEARRLLRAARALARVPAETRRDRTRHARRLKALCLAVIAYAGPRPFEAWGLRWDEVRWEERLLAVGGDRDKSRRQMRKPRKPRRIAVPPRLLDALAVVRDSPHAHPVFVFLSAWSRARRPDVHELDRWFREECKPFARARGVAVPDECTLYSFRHDWQTTGLEVESAEGVAAAAGNSPQVLLSTYDHTRNKRVREVADKVARHRRSGK
jgi:integrase